MSAEILPFKPRSVDDIERQLGAELDAGLNASAVTERNSPLSSGRPGQPDWPGAKAPGRACAREDNTESLVTDSDSTESAAAADPTDAPAGHRSGDTGPGADPDPAGADAERSFTERFNATMRQVAAYWNPPEIWSEQRPSLQEVLRYARTAPWTPPDGPIRVLGKAYAYAVVVPVTAVAYEALWIIERPARAITVLALLVVFWLTAPGQWLGHLAAVILRWFADVIEPVP